MPAPAGPCFAAARFSILIFLAWKNSNSGCHSARWMFLNWCSTSFFRRNTCKRKCDMVNTVNYNSSLQRA